MLCCQHNICFSFYHIITTICKILHGGIYMGIKAVKCPSCGADVMFDEGCESGFCEFCGSKVMQEKIIIEHRVDESGKYENYVRLADNAYSTGNYRDANDYYTKALEIRQGDKPIVFRKAISVGYVSESGKGNSEVIFGVKSAFSKATEEEKKSISEDIISLVCGRCIDKPAEFVGADSCDKYVRTVWGHLCLADKLYEYVDSSDKATVERYCRSVIHYCDSMNEKYEYTRIKDINKKMKFDVNLSLDGLSIRTGDNDDGLESYKIPDELVKDAKNIREKFVKESNKFVSAELEIIKTRIDKANEAVKALPATLRILYTISGVPAVIIAILVIFIKPVAGLVLFAVVIAAYILFKKTDSGEEAHNAYENLRNEKSEYSKVKNNLNK